VVCKQVSKINVRSLSFTMKLLCACQTVIATFWSNEEMGRNQDGLGGYTCNVLLDRPCAWIWAKLPVYLYIMVEFESV
jgi:hypothetical protein